MVYAEVDDPKDEEENCTPTSEGTNTQNPVNDVEASDPVDVPKMVDPQDTNPDDASTEGEDETDAKNAA